MDTSIVQEDKNATNDSVHENEDAPCKEDVFSPRVFVNTRRGKGKGTKRNISDAARVTESGRSIPPGAAEVLHIVTFPILTEVQISEQICIKLVLILWCSMNSLCSRCVKHKQLFFVLRVMLKWLHLWHPVALMVLRREKCPLLRILRPAKLGPLAVSKSLT